MNTLHLAVIALFSLMCGTAVGVLTWLSYHSAPAAILAGLLAVGGAFTATCHLVQSLGEGGRQKDDG